jgi:hypothetical protein
MPCLALAASALLAAAPPASPRSPWSVMAEQDVRAMHRIILESHPGPVDAENPDFKRWLQQGYREALGRAQRARDFGAYSATLQRYAAGFRDGHLQLVPQLQRTQARWPGFVVAQRQGRYVVATVEEGAQGLPPVGAELVACDGVSAAQLFERTVWPKVTGPDVEGKRAAQAPRLLLDEGDPEVALPRGCELRVDGAAQQVTLRYRDVAPEKLSERTRAAAFGAPPAFGVRPFGAGGRWVSIPAFWPTEGERTLAALRQVVAEAPSWRNVPVLVLDVRGNTGGSSMWGDNLLKGLYGEALFKARVEDPPQVKAQYVDWRASRANVAHLDYLGDYLAGEQGKDAPIVGYLQRVRHGLEAARRRGEPFFHLPEEGPQQAPQPAAAEPASLMKGRVFVLTDGRCASACLDFLDSALALPGVTHVGLPTSADSVYMEVRTELLPSGATKLGVPVKVYRKRPRAHNEAYVPKVRFEGDFSDGAALEQWVLGLAAAGK